MSKLPVVAIIGRPNTGKSTLFNRLVGHRRAIVSDTAGTTRDHVASRVVTDELDYLIVDTGGMGGGTEDKDFEEDVHAQSVLAIGAADLILFTVNAREDFTSSDHEVIAILRKKKKQHVPVILVPTKCDNDQMGRDAIFECQALGLQGEIIPVSGLNNLGIAELEESVVEELQKLHFSKEPERTEEEAAKTPRIAIIGKPNVGKSSIVNALMSDVQRADSPRLVSDIAGTTRDSTDTIIRNNDREFIFIDTAGLKRFAKTDEGIESYAYLRSIQAVEQADTVLLVLDGEQPISRQDKRVAGIAVDRGAGIIILLNKTDLMTKEQRLEKVNEIRVELSFCRYAPVLPVSAKTREGLLKAFDLIEMASRNRLRRISTKELNRWYQDSAAGQPLGAAGRSKLIMQTEDVPPTFVVFVKNPKQVDVTQLRFLENRLRETFDFQATPVRWITKSSYQREFYNQQKKTEK